MLEKIQHWKELNNLNFSSEEFIIFGSAILSMFGLRQNSDIDIIASPIMFVRLKSDPRFKIGLSQFDNEIYYHNNNISIFKNLKPILVEKSWEEIKDKSVFMEGYYFLCPTHFLEWKLSYGRPQDLNDIDLIQRLKLRGEL